MELKIEQLEFPEGCNVVVGQSHFKLNNLNFLRVATSLWGRAISSRP
jgi:adenosine/AMP kinase